MIAGFRGFYGVDRDRLLTGGFFQQGQAEFGLVGAALGPDQETGFGVELGKHQGSHFVDQPIERRAAALPRHAPRKILVSMTTFMCDSWHKKSHQLEISPIKKPRPEPGLCHSAPAGRYIMPKVFGSQVDTAGT